MVGLSAIRRDHDEDADDGEEVEDNSPPCIQREARPGLEMGEDGSEERDDPCQLFRAGLAFREKRSAGGGEGVCLPQRWKWSQVRMGRQ